MSGANTEKFDRLVLPGVGSFDHAMQFLHKNMLRDYIIKQVLKERKPLLGICLGMQLLAESSEEGRCKGLGLIPGRVLKISPKNTIINKVPNIGWCHASPVSDYFISAYKKSPKLPRFYFVHSYYFDCAQAEHVVMHVQIDRPYCAAVRSDHIWGAQFHPEKSHKFGLEFLKLWLES